MSLDVTLARKVPCTEGEKWQLLGREMPVLRERTGISQIVSGRCKRCQRPLTMMSAAADDIGGVRCQRFFTPYFTMTLCTCLP